MPHLIPTSLVGYWALAQAHGPDDAKDDCHA